MCLSYVFSSLTSVPVIFICFFFFFNDTATTEIYTLSLHDALPIWSGPVLVDQVRWPLNAACHRPHSTDRKSTRLNSSHITISYAVFCLKKKKKKRNLKHTRS